jgi:hypothetical protein
MFVSGQWTVPDIVAPAGSEDFSCPQALSIPQFETDRRFRVEYTGAITGKHRGYGDARRRASTTSAGDGRI